MHAGRAATHPTHRTAGAPEPTDSPPTRQETAAREAAPTSLAGPAAFLVPKTNGTAPVLCAAIRSRRAERRCLQTVGGGGGSAWTSMTSSLSGRSPARSDPGRPSTAAKARGTSGTLVPPPPAGLYLPLSPPTPPPPADGPSPCSRPSSCRLRSARDPRWRLHPSITRGLLLAPHPSPAQRGPEALPGTCL